MRTLVCGDLHGNYRGLEQVLDRAGFRNYRDQLIFLGDAVDRGKESYEVVEKLLSIRHLIALRGNHDEWFLTFLQQNRHPMNWLMGAQQTLESYARHCFHPSAGARLAGAAAAFNALDVPASHRAFFQNQRLYYRDEKQRIFVHAGWNLTDTLAETETHSPREFYWNRSLWNRALAFPANSPTKLRMADPYAQIFIGHSPTIFSLAGKEGQPLYRAGVWNLDTGAGYPNGRVSLLDVDTQEVWQSDLTSTLYPD